MKSKLVTCFVLSALFLAQGCSLSRHSSYSYDNEDEYAQYAAQKNGLSETFDELGYSPSKKLTEEEEQAVTKRLKLKKLEATLTEKEKKQYYGLKPYIENDDERISFLSLPTVESRERFAVQKGFFYKTKKLTPEVKQAIENGDIVVGMTREAVSDSWGDPEAVEVAGNRQFGNEKWTYIEYLTTSEGYQKEERVVIFEGGKVVGWRRYQ
ncbi:MAG: hypothetical protein IPM57_01755 [Oligoflexia bacterium]|nr:hypothetical protein [Oligoflexia bacterium]